MPVTDARADFLRKYPGGFSDPDYLGDGTRGERVYKWRAHEHFVDTLGGGQLERLLAQGHIEELVRRAQQVVSRGKNLLSTFEATAFRQGLAHEAAAATYFGRLADLLSAGPGTDVFGDYASALASLPAQGKTQTKKWTIATVLPFLARPDAFMFVKPTITKAVAARLGVELHYSAQPNWPTYDRVLRMSQRCMDLLSDLGPRDMIDIQSFFWITGKQ